MLQDFFSNFKGKPKGGMGGFPGMAGLPGMAAMGKPKGGMGGFPGMAAMGLMGGVPDGLKSHMAR